MTPELQEALSSLGNVEKCIVSILSFAEERRIKELAKWKFGEDAQKIRTALQRLEKAEKLAKALEYYTMPNFVLYRDGMYGWQEHTLGEDGNWFGSKVGKIGTVAREALAEWEAK